MSCTHNIPLVSLRSATQSRARALHAAENNGTELTGTTGPRVTTHSRTELKTVGLYIYYCRACRCLRTPLCWFVIFSSSFSYTPPDLSMKALFSSSSSLSLSLLAPWVTLCVRLRVPHPSVFFVSSVGWVALRAALSRRDDRTGCCERPRGSSCPSGANQRCRNRLLVHHVPCQ